MDSDLKLLRNSECVKAENDNTPDRLIFYKGEEIYEKVVV